MTVRKLIYMVCKWCGKEIAGKSRSRQFCDNACRAAHWRHEQSLKPEAPSEAQAEINEARESILRNVDNIAARALAGQAEALEALGVIDKRLNSWERVIPQKKRAKSGD